MQKVTSRKKMVKILESNGFLLAEISKHEKWENQEENKSIYIPRKHGNGFSRVLHERLLKEAGISLN